MLLAYQLELWLQTNPSVIGKCISGWFVNCQLQWIYVELKGLNLRRQGERKCVVFWHRFQLSNFFPLKTRCLVMVNGPNLSRHACVRLANPILYELIFASSILVCVFELLNLAHAYARVGVWGSLGKCVVKGKTNLPYLFRPFYACLSFSSFYFCLVS